MSPSSVSGRGVGEDLGRWTRKSEIRTPTEGSCIKKDSDKAAEPYLEQEGGERGGNQGERISECGARAQAVVTGSRRGEKHCLRSGSLALKKTEKRAKTRKGGSARREGRWGGGGRKEVHGKA